MVQSHYKTHQDNVKYLYGKDRDINTYMRLYQRVETRLYT